MHIVSRPCSWEIQPKTLWSRPWSMVKARGTCSVDCFPSKCWSDLQFLPPNLPKPQFECSKLPFFVIPRSWPSGAFWETESWTCALEFRPCRPFCSGACSLRWLAAGPGSPPPAHLTLPALSGQAVGKERKGSPESLAALWHTTSYRAGNIIFVENASCSWIMASCCRPLPLFELGCT